MTSTYQFKVPPFEHQRQALQKGYNLKNFAYLMEMGTGKSKATVDNAGILFMLGEIDRMAVIAPKSAYEDWVEKHFPENFPYDYKTHTWRGWGTKTEQANFDFTMRSDKFKVLTINMEAFSSDSSPCHGVLRNFLQAGKSMATVDESTGIKNQGAKRTEAIIQHGTMAEYRRILTGSPITKSPLDAYSQFDFLQNGLIGHRNFFAYRSKYCLMKRVDPKNSRDRRAFPVAYRNLEQLRDKIRPWSFRVLKRDCLDLPPKTWVMRKTQMSELQEKLYESMRLTGTVYHRGKISTAEQAMTRVLRCHQISCGHLVYDDGTIEEISDNKIQDLLSIADETASQLVIWSQYKYDIARLYTALEKKYGRGCCVQYYGDVPHDQRIQNRKMFEAGEARFFLGNTQTGARAINELAVADTMIYYSNNWSLDLRLQSEDRTHRYGQQSDKCLYIDQATPGTIDIKIIQALRDNIDVATTINGDNYKEWLI